VAAGHPDDHRDLADRHPTEAVAQYDLPGPEAAPGLPLEVGEPRQRGGAVGLVGQGHGRAAPAVVRPDRPREQHDAARPDRTEAAVDLPQADRAAAQADDHG
jgi:hypothetical protein